MDARAGESMYFYEKVSVKSAIPFLSSDLRFFFSFVVIFFLFFTVQIDFNIFVVHQCLFHVKMIFFLLYIKIILLLTVLNLS